jgi:hypothetical protein
MSRKRTGRYTWPHQLSGPITGDGRMWWAADRWLRTTFSYGLPKRCDVIRGGSRHRPFHEAREFARQLGLKGQKEWQAWVKSGDRPEGIPSDPSKAYPAEWVSLGDWLGTGRIASKNKKFTSFHKARKFVRELDLKGQADWRSWCKSNKRPSNIPSNPATVYASQWISWGDWFGTGTVAVFNREFLPFRKARVFVHLGPKEWIFGVSQA